MRITLGEALKIAKEIENKIAQLRDERQANSVVSYGANEKPEMPERTVALITGEIRALSVKANFLRNLVAKTNLETKLGETDESLAEGLLRLNYLLAERGSFAQLLKQHKRERTSMFGSTQYTEITYDMKAVEAEAKEIEREIRKLRMLIDKANIMTEVNVPDEVLDY